MSTKQRPKAKVYKTELPSGKKARIEVSYGESTITRPVRVFGQKVKDKKGKVVRVEVPVDATFITLKIKGSKKVLAARSCCKPPDTFNRTVGKKFALRHLFDQDVKRTLKSKDRRHIVELLCPQLFKRVKQTEAST